MDENELAKLMLELFAEHELPIESRTKNMSARWFAMRLAAAGYAKRSDTVEECARVADTQREPRECDNLLPMDLETGVSDCTLEINGIGCLCAERMECADHIARALRNLKDKP